MKLISKDPIYFTQRNNQLYPMRSCFPTSMAMAMRNNGYLYVPVKPKGYSAPLELDDYIMHLANSDVGRSFADKLGIPKGTKFLNEWWSVMDRVGNYLLYQQGKSCRWTTANVDQIKAEIDKGKMVVVGTVFTHSGHIVTVSGYNGNNLIVCDPYGNVNSGYKDLNGKNVEVSAGNMSKIRKNVILFS